MEARAEPSRELDGLAHRLARGLGAVGADDDRAEHARTLSDDLDERDDHPDHHEHHDQRLRHDPEGRHYFLACSWRLMAAIVRLMRSLIAVVLDTSADWARRIRCGEPVANATFARWIARP